MRTIRYDIALVLFAACVPAAAAYVVALMWGMR